MSKLFTIAEGLENMGAIKTGGQGSVYKGQRIGEIISAIKLLPTPVISKDEENKHYKDFINEVKKLQRVGEEPNPNIVRLLSYGVSETGSFPYIEMEFIDGPDLGELLTPPHPPIFTLKEITKVAEHLSNALAHCHRLEVKHGDIKSNNVKYNRQTGNYVLLDFGLAILSDEERRTSLRRAGAIEFMAPEQAQGELYFESDVYSFGIILYELVAGRVPFVLDGNTETARNKVMLAHMEEVPPNLLQLRKQALPSQWTEEEKSREMQVPDWLLGVIDKCLQKAPNNRFDNGMKLHDYITHHHVHAPLLATLSLSDTVKEDGHLQKLKEALAVKDEELAELKDIVLKQDRELQAFKKSGQSAQPVYGKKRGVSRAGFNALLMALLIVTALAVYGLFFQKSAVGGVQAATSLTATDSSVVTDEIDKQSSENSNAAKKPKTGKEDQVKDSTVVFPPVITQNEETVEKESQVVVKKNETRQDEEDVADDDGPRYKVRNKAYFHNEPDASAKRDAFIIHWNNAVLKPLDEKDGFIYVVFTNHLGQTSKGWLVKSDLVEVE